VVKKRILKLDEKTTSLLENAVDTSKYKLLLDLNFKNTLESLKPDFFLSLYQYSELPNTYLIHLITSENEDLHFYKRNFECSMEALERIKKLLEWYIKEASSKENLIEFIEEMLENERWADNMIAQEDAILKLLKQRIPDSPKSKDISDAHLALLNTNARLLKEYFQKGIISEAEVLDLLSDYVEWVFEMVTDKKLGDI
jgi:radical SAM superfamily enzyme YgiQ (UPF0313 family)